MNKKHARSTYLIYYYGYTVQDLLPLTNNVKNQECVERLYISYKNLHLIAYLIRTPTFEWYAMWCGFRNRYQKNIYKELKLHAQNFNYNQHFHPLLLEFALPIGKCCEQSPLWCHPNFSPYWLVTHCVITLFLYLNWVKTLSG